MLNKIFFILVLNILITACASQTTLPITVYTVAPQWEDNTGLGNKPEITNQAVLKISPIRSTDTFTSRNIIYTDKNYSRNHYVYSQWSDAPVKMLQTLFQVQLEKSRQFKAVLSSTSIARADLSLECTLYDFSHHINPNNSSNGIIRAGCHLINNKTRTVLASRELMSSMPSQTENAQGAAIALNKAANEVSIKLLNWLASIKYKK